MGYRHRLRPQSGVDPDYGRQTPHRAPNFPGESFDRTVFHRNPSILFRGGERVAVEPLSPQVEREVLRQKLNPEATTRLQSQFRRADTGILGVDSSPALRHQDAALDVLYRSDRRLLDPLGDPLNRGVIRVPERLLNPFDSTVGLGAHLRRKFRPSDIFIPDTLPIDGGDRTPSWWLRRDQVTVPISPTYDVNNDTVFANVAETNTMLLPRYEFFIDRVGSADEPRITIESEQGVDMLTITLAQTTDPNWPPQATELPHAVGMSLKYRVPVLDGGTVVQVREFTSVVIDATDTMITASLPLTSPGLRAQVVAALGSLEAAATFIVGRGFDVAVPVGTFPDGQPAFSVVSRLLEWMPQPSPVVLSDRQRARLGGEAGAQFEPMIRIREPFGGQTHSYWQDAAVPHRFYFLPDQFLLARTSEGAHRPMLRVRVAPGTTEADIRVDMEFHARPVIDSRRMDSVRTRLESEAHARGATEPVELEIVPEVQPFLRLALPGLAGGLTERPGTQIDLEVGLVHAEAFTLDEFRTIYDALYGASLTLLRGEIRLDVGGSVEDVPIELRLDHTVGQLLDLRVDDAVDNGFGAQLTNTIESPVRIDELSVAGLLDGERVELKVSGLEPGQHLSPGGGVRIRLVPPAAPGVGAQLEAVAVDESAVKVEPDRTAIWNAMFDARAASLLKRKVTVRAVPQLFSSPAVPDDKVVMFVVVIENGDSVQVTENELVAEGTASIPFIHLLTGSAAPPIRYRTETLWQSGGIGTSPWRETDASILLPVRTVPSN